MSAILLQEFFLTVKDIMRRSPATGPDSYAKWNREELDLNDAFTKCQACVHEALCGRWRCRLDVLNNHNLIKNRSTPSTCQSVESLSFVIVWGAVLLCVNVSHGFEIPKPWLLICRFHRYQVSHGGHERSDWHWQLVHQWLQEIWHYSEQAPPEKRGSLHHQDAESE